MEILPPGDGHHIYQIELLDDGRIAYSTGYGASIQILDPSSNALTELGGKASPDAKELRANFFAGFDRMSNGNFVVTNWQGHGPWNGFRGHQLLEYSADGELIWSWKQKTPQGVLTPRRNINRLKTRTEPEFRGTSPDSCIEDVYFVRKYAIQTPFKHEFSFTY